MVLGCSTEWLACEYQDEMVSKQFSREVRSTYPLSPSSTLALCNVTYPLRDVTYLLQDVTCQLCDCGT